MVNQWQNRFEEIVHEMSGLESPSLLRKRELAVILLRNLEEELEEYEYRDYDSVGFSFDERIFNAIFQDPRGQNY